MTMIVRSPYRQRFRPSVWVAGIVLAAIPVFSFDPEANSSWIPQMLSLGLFFLLLIEILQNAKDLRLPFSMVLLVAWLVVAAVSILLSSSVHVDGTSFWSLVKVVGMTMLFTYVLDEQRDVQILLWHVVASFPVVVLLNINTLSGYGGGIQALSSDNERLAGTLGNANTMALYALIVTWAALTIVVTGRHRLKWIAAALVPLAAWIVVLTGSRKGLIGIPLLVATSYWFHARQSISRSPMRKVLIMVFFVAMTWAVTQLLLSTTQASRLTMLLEGQEESSASGRIDMALAGWKVFVENPFLGVGFDNFRSVGWRYGSLQGSYSHSTVVEVLSGTGIVGFAVYFGALMSLFVLFYRVSTGRYLPSFRKVFQWALCLWVIFVWFNVFSVQYDSRMAWPILGALAGYALRYSKRSATDFSFSSGLDVPVNRHRWLETNPLSLRSRGRQSVR